MNREKKTDARVEQISGMIDYNIKRMSKAQAALDGQPFIGVVEKLLQAYANQKIKINEQGEITTPGF